MILARGGDQAEVPGRELGPRFVGFRFTKQSRDSLVGNLRYLVEKRLVELLIEPDDTPGVPERAGHRGRVRARELGAQGWF